MEQLERIDRLLQRGFVLSIDYGYTHGEIATAGKFPQGSLMPTRAIEPTPDVLLDPGERDITAHVNFTALIERGKELGWETLGFSPQQEFLARAGARDNFAYALGADTEDAGRAAAHAAQDLALRHGRDVPRSAPAQGLKAAASRYTSSES